MLTALFVGTFAFIGGVAVGLYAGRASVMPPIRTAEPDDDHPTFIG
jgi:hypothetical protein